MPDIRTLPEPQWASAASICTGCSYSLEGLAPPIPCPECGTLYEARQFILVGVPTARSTTPWPVLTLAILAAIVLNFSPQLFLMGSILFGVAFVLIAAIIGIAIVTVAILSARKRRAGVCQLIFTPGRLTCLPLKAQQSADSITSIHSFPFTGHETATLTPVGAVWAKLRLTGPDGKRLFQAGVRCPRADIPAVQTTIRLLIHGSHNLWQTAITSDTLQPMAQPNTPTTTPTQSATNPG